MRYFIVLVVSIFIVSCGIFDTDTEKGNIEGTIYFSDLQPADNIEILLGRTESSGIGYAGTWKTSKKTNSNAEGEFEFKSIDCKSWAVKLSNDNQILNSYEVVPISHIIDVKGGDTHKIEFILTSE